MIASTTVQIPKEKALDSTLSLMLEPYEFLSKRASVHKSDIFEFRLFGQKTICLQGEEGAKLFYDPEACGRNHPPEALRSTLQGRGGLQEVDGPEHEKRKGLFMSFMTPQSIQSLLNLYNRQWRSRLNKWELADEVNLFEEMQNMLTVAACQWVGIPHSHANTGKYRKILVSLFSDPGALGWRHIRARVNRLRAQRWIEPLVKEARQNFMFAANTPFDQIVRYRDAQGHLLSEKVAAVEIINLLRPIVAVSGYLVFGAHAAFTQPYVNKERLLADEEYLEMFTQEVRRFYPFFPASIGRALGDLEFQGYKIKKDTRIILDLYGINHDPRIWQNPQEFAPLRFKNWDGSAFNFVPQGGGEHHPGRRCAGEWLTISLIKTAVQNLIREITFDMPSQDLKPKLKEAPGFPPSGFIIKNVRIRKNAFLHRSPLGEASIDFH